MRKANIIHLSDIHFDDSESSNKLLDAIKDDLLLLKKELEEYHILIITGDCVDKGKTDLFDNFIKKLDRIIKECGITRKKVIINVGNHDTDLNNPVFKGLKGDIAEKANEIEKRLGSLYPEYNASTSKFAETQNGIGVNDITIANHSKTKLFKFRIISLNSAWYTTVNNKYGELCIGDEQIKKIKEKINAKRISINDFDSIILCMHHPLDWFKYEEREKIEKLIQEQHVDYILHGHIHDSNVENISNIDNTTHVFCTGIPYKKDGGINPSSSKSGMRYSIYQINKDTKTMNIFIRSTNTKGVFKEDSDLYSNVKNGFFTIPLVKPDQFIMPFKCVDAIPKTSIALTKELVNKILYKENILFDFYCKQVQKIEKIGQEDNKNYKEFEAKWKQDKNITAARLSKLDNSICRKEYNKNEFKKFCFEILISLNAIFFNGDVRFLIRHFDKNKEAHVAFCADGVFSETNDIMAIKSFPWKNGLIYWSFVKKEALLKSCNHKYYEKGNSDNWKNSLTITISDIVILHHNEAIPLLSMNIAISSIKNESCLEALAMSSIYNKISAIFKLYDEKVRKIETILTNAEDRK